jgi:hypothetical protein
MIIRFGKCGPYGLGRKSCLWFNNLKDAIEYAKKSSDSIYIKIGNKPYKEISNSELYAIYSA